MASTEPTPPDPIGAPPPPGPAADQESATDQRGPETVASESGWKTLDLGGLDQPEGTIPGHGRRASMFERGVTRLLANVGVIGIAVVLGAILVSRHVDGWIVGLTVGLTTTILTALLWSPRPR